MYIKGFNSDLTCRGYQFEVGKEYKIEHDGPVELCSATVFHFCDSLEKVNRFYDVRNNCRYCVIEALGEVVSDGEKSGSDHIRIVRELTQEEVDMMAGKVNGNAGLFNSGNRNSGDRNSGNWNSGDRNSGNWNSGDRNSGNWNSGYGNKSDFSTGVFCNEPDMSIRIFNRPSGMSMKDFLNSKYYDALSSVPLELVVFREYTAEEKAGDPGKEAAGGRLVERTPEEAWAEWWKKLTEENRDIVKQIPNFDADVFKDITGIEV